MGGFLQTLSRIGPARLVLIALVGAGLLGFFAFVANRLSEPDYGLLYGDLDLKDSAQVAAKLDTLNIPYQVRANGGAIYVPVDQVGRLRLTMAELGVPRGGSVGYEIFDKADTLGATSFQQGVNEMRALEGELARTIQSLSVVDTARVHLVMPKRELFTRAQQEPSASIVLHTRRSDALSKSQVGAILNLVATAVPGLKTGHISVIDQNGNLLARGGDAGSTEAETASNAEEQRTAYETRIARSVEDMLERSLGPGHARVDVNAEMDFDRQTTSQESFDPDGQVVRSTEAVKELTDSTQPADSPVSVQSNLPNGQTPPAGSGAKSHESKTDETTNYEVSKKTVSLTREGGVIKRLSVAVLVDGTYTTNDKGERSWAPRSADDLQTLTRLVRSAVGFDEKRGDRVEVVNMRFAEPEELPAAAGTAPFLGLEKSDLFRIGELAGAFLIALLVIFMVLRPLVKRSFRDAKEFANAAQKLMQIPHQGGGLPALSGGGSGGTAMGGGTGTDLVPAGMEDESMIDIGQVEGRVKASTMRKIGEIVDKHPEEAVAIIRNWMYSSAAPVN